MKWADNINVWNCDCLQYIKEAPDNFWHLAIVDPPYGININMNMGLKKGQKKRHIAKSWDNEPPSAEYFYHLARVSVNQIIWGGNYFNLGPSRHYIFWDKKTPAGMSFSDGELAWTSFDRAIRKVTLNNKTGDKIHPTQKPVNLYEWLLRNYSDGPCRILDTHLGSGSSAIACYIMGYELAAFEIDEGYYSAAYKRFKLITGQKRLF